MNLNDFAKMAKRFIVNEGERPGVNSYIQSLSEVLNSIRPSSVSDSRRLEVAKDNLLNIRRHVRRLEEHVSTLQEELKVLQEEKTKSIED
jgi:hypothetical protein